MQRTGIGPDIELVTEENAGRAIRRQADRANALPGADEPLPPKARVEEARCAKPHKLIEPALACAVAYLQAAGIDAFLRSVGLTARDVSR